MSVAAAPRSAIGRLERAGRHLLLAALATGLGFAAVVQAPSHVWVLALGGGACALAASSLPARTLFAALALAAAGWSWGAVRVTALDASVLTTRIGDAAAAVVEITGPPRRGTFRLRVPAKVRMFDDARVDERVLLELPRGRSPPQGAVLELVVARSG